MPDWRADAGERVTRLVGDQAAAWDLAGVLPVETLRTLGKAGLLCAEVPVEHGGVGAGSLDNGEFTAHVGSLCGSLRSVMTSQGMAAWTIQRLGDARQRREYLPRLTGGELAAVAFSEPDAGSDVTAMATEIRSDGDTVVVEGRKSWTTAARYADVIAVFGRYGDGGGVVLVPAGAPGVTIRPVPNPSGCRAAGHADVVLDAVRLPATAVLGGGGQSLQLLVTTALAYGRISVAWGCAGILRACLSAAGAHARGRRQFGRPLAEHQLVARHLAELAAAEQVATRVCEHASRCWDARSPELVIATVLAKYVSSTEAARGAAAAVQVLASAGAQDGHVVARAYRDAKLMELIEGSTEICQIILAQHAVAQAS
ncbi:acyl-CoA dehydrogenase family protein [Acrocarpospora macrocephala]|uniref:Acyl-CoA dehydrogenase n=1 Tax=Acrocarpospora macrocephala TaxID=150177 RepID=A0A5M3WMY8_9ACTN|nr:acyl-CoA dehydrogenase family protein [Acrocarpospora macrocephala]GES10254.1 acyl-CoA dehydrogenase [Acrocarpospora macrocephala]